MSDSVLNISLMGHEYMMYLDKQSILRYIQCVHIYNMYVHVYVFVVYICTCDYSCGDFQRSLPLHVTYVNVYLDGYYVICSDVEHSMKQCSIYYVQYAQRMCLSGSLCFDVLISSLSAPCWQGTSFSFS